MSDDAFIAGLLEDQFITDCNPRSTLQAAAKDLEVMVKPTSSLTSEEAKWLRNRNRTQNFR
jgi:hypothetical protein